MLSSSLEKPRHVLSVSQFSPEFIDILFHIIDRNMVLIRKHGSVAGRYVGLHMDITFYEPSTRTRKSFEVAGFNYGMSVSVTENASQFSSAVKGESLEDTIRVIAGYDPICIVLRHPERGAAKQAAMVSNVPIINGGDGDGEHPTQALLDLYTIHREIGRLDGLNIMAVGDNRYGRTIHSLIKLLSHYPGTSITCVNPPSLGVPKRVKRYAEDNGVEVRELVDLKKADLREADVVYVTRLQKERLPKKDLENLAELYNHYRLTLDRARVLKPSARILHPLPKTGEIDPAVDLLPQAAYYRQAAYGVPVRMLLLDWVIVHQLRRRIEGMNGATI